MNTTIRNVKTRSNVNEGLLTKEDEILYFTRLKEAEELGDYDVRNHYRDLIFTANQRLVNFIASSYIGKGMDMDDIRQEGNMGLLKAIDKFDVKLGNKFVTYATYWIKQYIEFALYYENDKIRIPVYFKRILNSVNRCKTELTTTLGRTPSVSEISAKLGIEESKVLECLNFNLDICSLDKRIKVEDDTTLLDMVSSSELDPQEKYYKRNQSEVLMSFVDDLSTKEKFVILNRFGLNNNPALSLEQIGRELNVSRERARQIEKQALNLIRTRLEESCLI
jgi:RNA polymerase sigma factor (sigma-70 family)